MFAAIVEDKVQHAIVRISENKAMPGMRSRELVIAVDDEAAEAIKTFVDTLMEPYKGDNDESNG